MADVTPVIVEATAEDSRLPAVDRNFPQQG